MHDHHHHHHDHDHDHDHGHHHRDHQARPGHNHAGPDHLHSHVHGGSDREAADEMRTLATSFVEGFRAAEDKTSYLRLAGIPFQMPGAEGLTLNLVDAAIHSEWQVGTASPAFATRELVYMPFPGEMVRARETMRFTYVSLAERRDVDLQTLLQSRLAA